jgi:hypothetical protein
MDMRDERLLAGVLLLVLLCPSAVSAANTQGLAWGLSVGDRIDYTVASTMEGAIAASTTQSVSDCYVVVTSLPEIPYVVTSVPFLQMWRDFNQSFANGTRYSFPWIAVPVGNWTLLTGLMQRSIPDYINVTTIDTIAEWGIDTTQDDGSITTYQALRVSKGDGAMNYFKVEMQTTSPSTHHLMEVSRKGWLVPLSMLQLASIGITLASLGVIIVFGVLIVRKRSSNPFSM